MLLQQLKDWPGSVKIGEKQFSSVSDFLDSDALHDTSIDSVILYRSSHRTSAGFTPETPEITNNSNSTMYRISVRAYMTKKSTANFDFMKKWNNDNPMPLRIMVGEKVKETAGMVYMKLHGDITAPITYFCLKCGKPITNPISRYFGLGPQCGGHNYVNPFNSEEELKAEIEKYRKEYLQKITWEGWIIKSAIEEEIKL